jgi:hypothetical protein
VELEDDTVFCVVTEGAAMPRKFVGFVFLMEFKEWVEHLIQPPRNPQAIVLYCSICIYFANLNLYETKLLSTMIMIIIVMAISCMLKFEFIILR